MKLIAVLFAILLAAAVFTPSADASHRRILKKLAKGALLAKLLKPKFGILPLPLPLPLPIPIHISKAHHVIAEPEPVIIQKHASLSLGHPMSFGEPLGLGHGFGHGLGGY